MPELPEVSAIVRNLTTELSGGKRVRRVELGAISALKTFDPGLEELVDRTATGAERRGKYICLECSGLWVVTHLARGGWLRWYDRLPATTIRPGRGPLALRLGFDDGSGLDLTEMGTERRLAVWIVHQPADVEGVAALGPDPLHPDFDEQALGRVLRAEPGTLKSVLVRQSVLAGVGNAYSDEALHAAKLSPFKPTGHLTDDDVSRLHVALVGVLRQAVERTEGLATDALKGEKHHSMRVHGRTGEPCPVCGDTVREVWSASRSFQYCATCQTGGKPLADRRLSRLLK